MKTLEDLFYEHNMEVGSVLSRELQKVCVEYIEGILRDSVDVAALPEEIKAKAKEYCETTLQHSYADTREELEEDVIAAWLEGFGFCLAGKVHVARALSNKEG